MMLPGGSSKGADQRKHERRGSALDPGAGLVLPGGDVVDIGSAERVVDRRRCRLRGVADFGKQLFAADGVIRGGLRRMASPVGGYNIGLDRRVVRVVNSSQRGRHPESPCLSSILPDWHVSSRV